MHRGIILLLLPIALTACAPTAVTVVSLAAGGISYATTGKGIADHALSNATQADCAMHRALRERPVCTTWPVETLAESSTATPAEPTPNITVANGP